MNRNPTTNTVYTSCRLTQKEPKKSIITRKRAAPNKGRIKKDEKKQRNFLGRESNKTDQTQHNHALETGGMGEENQPQETGFVFAFQELISVGGQGAATSTEEYHQYKHKSKASIYFSLYKPRKIFNQYIKSEKERNNKQWIDKWGSGFLFLNSPFVLSFSFSFTWICGAKPKAEGPFFSFFFVCISSSCIIRLSCFQL